MEGMFVADFPTPPGSIEDLRRLIRTADARMWSERDSYEGMKMASADARMAGEFALWGTWFLRLIEWARGDEQRG